MKGGYCKHIFGSQASDADADGWCMQAGGEQAKVKGLDSQTCQHLALPTWQAAIM